MNRESSLAMNTAGKTMLFVLLPMLVIMVAAGAWHHYHGRRIAKETAQRQLTSAAELTSRLVQRHIDQLEYAVESIMVMQHLDEYFMHQQLGLLDEAEDARLWVELAMERLAQANPEVIRIECYSAEGDRIIAVVHGRRELAPVNAQGQPWMTSALNGETYYGFESDGNLRVASPHKTEFEDEPIAVVTMVFDFTEGASQAAQFATRHLEHVVVDIDSSDGKRQFHIGELPRDAGSIKASSPVDSLDATVTVRQQQHASLAGYHANERTLIAALALITCGLLVIAAIGTRAVTKDLRTARLRTDEANRHLRQHAKKLVEAHAALATKTSELASANRNLQRSNKDLTDFAYVASHDLQAPLRAIVGFAQLLHGDYHDQLDQRGRDWIHQIIAGTERMEMLINDLLAYSRVETRGKHPKPTDFEKVFDDAVGLLRTQINEAGAKVSHGPLPTLPADRAQMVQLFQNLIGNAVKYRGDKTPEVSVTSSQNGSSWVFGVADNGIGIDPKHHQRIFEIFKRLHTQDTYEGTGIGLAVCRRIVERHGGKMWIESQPGKGSKFSFSIDHQQKCTDEQPTGA